MKEKGRKKTILLSFLGEKNSRTFGRQNCITLCLLSSLIDLENYLFICESGDHWGMDSLEALSLTKF